MKVEQGRNMCNVRNNVKSHEYPDGIIHVVMLFMFFGMFVRIAGFSREENVWGDFQNKCQTFKKTSYIKLGGMAKWLKCQS